MLVSVKLCTICLLGAENTPIFTISIYFIKQIFTSRSTGVLNS